MQQRPYDLFMSAFNDIEAYLRRSLYGEQDGRHGHQGFRAMLDEYRAGHAHLRPKQYEELLSLTDLRNALTHGRRLNDEPLAEPTEAAVAAIRRLREELTGPKLLMAFLGHTRPVTAAPGDSVRQVLDTMYENDFSQVPVYDGSAYAGLLTTNTVARWVADQMRRHGGLAEDAPVEEALKFSEGAERVEHVSRSTTAPQALWRFTTAAREGRPLTAVIVTHNGRPTEAPLGIAVAEDLARLAG
ncbi:CBS domain-containing protein [Streptomyces chitinivorans]|uniref:CBS domain-containing protein n=1 Tax=Streptomyces chitinivorans TaxID=1257027 RepID=A0ABW7HQ78_9ACTN|nr:CBS domain-containing protein [Streptomyces chitinivorans]MDH2411269.1 CBS domain-containing protein [Streptomyces chitinivorans]